MENSSQNHYKVYSWPEEGTLEYQKMLELFNDVTVSNSPINGWIRIGNVHCPADGAFANSFLESFRDYISLQFNKLSMITVKIINSSNNPLPSYETLNSAGMDVRAYLDGLSPENPLKVYGGSAEVIFATPTSKAKIRIDPFTRVLIPTGLKIELPEGKELQVRPRSGMALKQGITIINTPGTVDADYRGDVGIPVINLSTEPVWIESGERICQFVFKSVDRAEFEEVTTLSITERGEGGFGHTGTK